jgi:hypothetical protein
MSPAPVSGGAGQFNPDSDALLSGGKRSFAQITNRNGAILSAARPGSVNPKHGIPAHDIGAFAAKTHRVVAVERDYGKDQHSAIPMAAVSCLHPTHRPVG